MRRQKGVQVVLPRNSFAIQIKSSALPIDLTKKIPYLLGLEIPFFVGVVNQEKPSLKIYSGEYLPYFFSWKGRPRRLRAKLVDYRVGPDSCCESFGTLKWRLLFPLVTKVSAQASQGQLEDAVSRLQGICERTQGNIMSRRAEEHIYTFAGRPSTRMLAGVGSVKYFRENFYNRLAEAYLNFLWMIRNGRIVDKAEVRVYLDVFRNLKKRGTRFPRRVSKRYSELRAALNANN